MAKCTTYVIFRHGANSANQSLCDRRPVAVVEARDRHAACATRPEGHGTGLHSVLALEPAVIAWSNQRFSAVPASRASAADLELAQECCSEQARQDAEDEVGYGDLPEVVPGYSE